MPINDEREFLSRGLELGAKRYRDPEHPPSPKDRMPDIIQEKLQELQTVLEANREDRETARIKSKEREKIKEEADRARREKDDRYEKLQQRFRRMRELEEDGRRADAERQIHEVESFRLVEEELEKLHQERLETRAVFQELLREREQERGEIIAALRERSK